MWIRNTLTNEFSWIYPGSKIAWTVSGPLLNGPKCFYKKELNFDYVQSPVSWKCPF